MNFGLVQHCCLYEWSGVVVPSQEYDCSKDGLYGLYGSADQEAGKHISKLLQYLPATLWDKVHNFTIGNWCKAVTDLFGTSRSLLEKPSFSVAETQLLKSQNSAKTLNKCPWFKYTPAAFWNRCKNIFLPNRTVVRIQP